MTCKNDVVSLLLLLLFLITYATAQTDHTAPPPPSDIKLGPVVDSTLAIIMLVFVVVFFSLGFFSVYFRRQAHRRMQGGTTTDTDTENGRSLRAGRGIGDEVIRTLPTFQYSAVRGLKIGKGELECAVCLNEFQDDETLRLLPKCSHVFHAECVDAWLSSHNTCPVCRANLLPRPGETTPVQIFDPETGYGESSGRQDPEAITRSPELNMASTSAWTNQNRPPRTRSTGLRFGGLFPRSHSTGNTLVQNYERFTLKLPEDIRSQIMNSSANLNRARSLVVLPRVRSEKKGYRSASTGRIWGFRMVPPFISRTGSVRSSGAGEEAVDAKSLLQSFRNPVDQEFLGERSVDRIKHSSES